jgi:hypothetical protein
MAFSFQMTNAREPLYSQEPDAKIVAEAVWYVEATMGGETTVTDDFIFVGGTTGKEEYETTTPNGGLFWANSGSPVALPERNEIVFPGGDGCLYGSDAVTGKLNWKADLNEIGGTKELFFETRPEVVGGKIITSLRSILEMGPQKRAPLIAITPGDQPKVEWIFGKCPR